MEQGWGTGGGDIFFYCFIFFVISFDFCACFSEWCVQSMEKYGVQPLKSWGNLPMNMIDVWKQRKCDTVFTIARMSKRGLSRCSLPPKDAATGEPLSKQEVEAYFSSLPLIAVMAATTTRRVESPSPDNMALFTLLLPSLARSLDCGFRYEYVLGYDQGDRFYDSEEVRWTATATAATHLMIPPQSVLRHLPP
jgi:hypothetical protein